MAARDCLAGISTVLPPLWIFISTALIVNLRTRTTINAGQQINAEDSGAESAETGQTGQDRTE